MKTQSSGTSASPSHSQHPTPAPLPSSLATRPSPPAPRPPPLAPRPSSLALLCATACILSAPRLVVAVEIDPDAIVAAVVEHSHALKSLDREAAAARAGIDQAVALTRPAIDVEARASRYTGLEDAAFGPQMSIPAVESRYGTWAGVTQPLWTGGRAPARRDAATASETAALEQRRASEADVRLDALFAYWHWSRTFHAERVVSSAVERTLAHAVDMRNLRQAGLATENELLSTEVLLDQTRLRHEAARRRTELARARVEHLTGTPLAVEAVPRKAADPDRKVEEVPFRPVSERAARAAAAAEVDVALARVEAVRAEKRPQVLLTARYEYANPNVLNIPPRDEWQDDAFAAVGLAWRPFDSGLTAARVAEARERALQAEIRLDRVEEQLAFEVREADIRLRDALGRVPVAARAEDSARRNLVSATDLWKGGLSRHSDVLDAHAALTAAEFEAVDARTDVLIARAAADHAAGRFDAPPAPRK